MARAKPIEATMPGVPQDDGMPDKEAATVAFDDLPGALAKFRKTYGRDPKTLDELANPPAVPKARPKVLMYSILPQHYLSLRQGHKEIVKLDNGLYRELPDNGSKNVRFHNHRLWIEAVYMERVRELPGYGISFVEAIPCNDGDPNAQALSEWLENFEDRGESFIASIELRGRESGLKPVVTAKDLRQEVSRLKAGKVQPPK